MKGKSLFSPRRVIPIRPVGAALARQSKVQKSRLLAQTGFFVLFCLAPVFDLLRYDLAAGHAWFLGMEWRAGLEAFSRGEIDALQAAGSVLLRVFLPLLGTAAALLFVAWRWGRLYCGWLCPHFSAVETINRLMRRASGKFSLWDAKPAPPREPDGSPMRYDRRWWLITVPVAMAFAFTWAVVFLTYLLPPMEVYGRLFTGELTRNQFIFIAAGTTVLSLEFLFARHLFCRYACAVGIFQSLAWMGNKDAMVVGFERERAADCASCYSACDHVCPMRLKPRSIKRMMFTCTQCGQCLSACATTQADNPRGPLLAWVAGEAARHNEAGFRHLRADDAAAPQARTAGA
jgi:polyferredoxin